MDMDDSDSTQLHVSASIKRSHLPTGSTPAKPQRKRVKKLNSPSIRKPLFAVQANDYADEPSFLSPKRKVSKQIYRIKCHIVSPMRKSPVKRHKWTYEEDRALVEFLSVSKTDPNYSQGDDTQWPSFRHSHTFWREAALHVRTSTSANILLTNNRVRGRVCTFLRGKFKNLEAAEEAYHLTLSDCLTELTVGGPKTRKQNPQALCTSKKTTSELTNELNHPEPRAVSLSAMSSDQLLEALSSLEEEKLEFVANASFLKLALNGGINTNPGNFATLSVKAMKVLQENGKNNLLLKFGYCIATTRPESLEPLFPINRMPFGLVEYQIEFFSSTNIGQVKVPEDYATWHETLCAEFPTRFNRLFRGPMWSGLPKQQQGSPLTARPNVAAPSTRTVQKQTASCDFTNKPELQIEALKQLKESNPGGRFWIKADAFDVKVALQESVKGVWNGDVDLGDGKVTLLRHEYESRRSLYQGNNLKEDKAFLELRLTHLIDALREDIKFLSTGLVSAEQEYEKKFNAPNTSQQLLKTLCWERVEFNTLLQQAQCFLEKYEAMVQFLHQPVPREKDVVTALQHIEKDALCYLRNLFVKKRQPGATHVLLFLVSDERRNRKPYALPVQYVPYKSIRDQFVRDLTDIIKREMIALGLKPVGAVSDGEFNSLRTQGSTRPLHVWQLIHDAKESVSRQSERTLMAMLKRTGVNLDGSPVVEKPDQAIPDAVIQELHELQTRDGMSFEDALTSLRGALVPDGYEPYPFRPKVRESLLDKLRSLIATYRYRHRVEELKTQGVDFTTYLYVPEVDPLTGDYFHEREDHCHILKRIWKHTREKGPEGMNLQGFDDAVHDSSTGLTLAALRGERKQSVQDAERMLSFLVAKFLREHGYVAESNYVEIVAGWHEAADGRGISQLQRCKKNYMMLNMILDEWMPWHKELYDFSTIDINRPVKDICGFSRETVIAVTTNIESMEFRRCQNDDIGYVEHPRAGTTDDVEAIIAFFHRILGVVFTLKQFKSGWRLVVREFCKRMAPDLPFYYWTLNERFRADDDDDHDSFDAGPDIPDDQDPSSHPLRLHRLRINRREDASIICVGRAFLPARNQTSIRQRIHRPLAQLPDPRNRAS